ncbi:unnamed protein product [Fusarium graminearum]|nr:unnamed protein product [Fusarium graminearum]
MANLLLAERAAEKVGKLGARNFVMRQLHLQNRFNRIYHYRRALYRDPNNILVWLELVRNARAKYGNDDVDIYNFEETGFITDIVTSAMVVKATHRLANWYSKYSLLVKNDTSWMLGIDGRSSHLSAGFDQFCKGKKAIITFMASHSSPVTLLD